MTSSPSWPASILDAIFLAIDPQMGQIEAHACLDLTLDLTLDQIHQALAATVVDLPVLGCCYTAHPIRDRWVPSSAPISDAVFVESDTDDLDMATRRWLSRPLDPRLNRPIRIVWMPHPDGGCRLLVTLLHIVVDGGGMMAIAQVFGAHLLGIHPQLPIDTRRGPELALERLPRSAWPLAIAAGLRELLQPLKLLGADPMPTLQGPNPNSPPCWTT
ncbi:MAG: hypothetical protein AAFS10_07445, partial [Myxococcota bacterium]